jgi:hypothetical protein
MRSQPRSRLRSDTGSRDARREEHRTHSSRFWPSWFSQFLPCGLENGDLRTTNVVWKVQFVKRCQALLDVPAACSLGLQGINLLEYEARFDLRRTDEEPFTSVLPREFGQRALRHGTSAGGTFGTLDLSEK